MASARSTASLRVNRDRLTASPPWFIECADPRPRVLGLREPQRAARVRQHILRLKRRVAHVPHGDRSEEHTSELQSRLHLVCRLLLEKKKKKKREHTNC